MIYRDDFLNLCRRIGNATAGTAADIADLAALAHEAEEINFVKEKTRRHTLVDRLLAYLEREIPRCPELAEFLPIVRACSDLKRAE